MARDWYSITEESLRAFAGFVFFLALAVGAVFGYWEWDTYSVQRKAIETVSKSQTLIQQLRTEQELDSYRTEYNRAYKIVRQAQAALDQEDYPEALKKGKEGLDILQDILDAIRYRGQAGVGRFVHVEGDVQYRRGEDGEWRKASARDVLYEGDYVRSGAGSAQIYSNFEDTLITVGAGTTMKFKRERGASGETNIGKMEYGWVGLNTSKRSSGVKTEYAEVRVKEHSKATVSQPQNSKQSRVVVTRGRAEVKSTATGDVVQLGELQQVEQRQGRLGPRSSLPAKPVLNHPADNYTVNIDTTEELVLSWNRVEGAVRYALQVSRSRLFADNIIEADDRAATQATLGVLEEGNFQWRVSAYDKEGLRGPWSEPLKFRVASFGGLGLGGDNVPPDLVLDEVNIIGHYLILQGRTEPGAMLEINGDPIAVDPSGSFSTSKQLTEQGWVAIVFRAVDEAGNETTETKRVYIDLESLL